MKNYIIISILTTIVILLVVYLGDYIKGIYSIEDFENANGNANANTNGDIKTTYERLLEARRTDFYEKKSPLTTMKQEESLNLQTENYRNGVYDKYSSISDPIGDEFLPYTIKNYKEDPAAISKNNMNQYTIINVYKNTLDRQPTDKEINRNLQDFYENDIDEELLKLRIYNSTEYKIITNMQSNDIKPELITNISKGQLADKLKTYYKDQHNTILTNTRVLDVLIKCYIHFQFNDYLFKAMLMHDKYMAFENRVRTEYIVSDKKILDVFNETFLLSELRLIANELKRQDILKRKALQTPIALYNNNQSDINSSNINMGTGKHISDIVRNSDNVFNINIMVNDDKKTSMPFSKRPPQQQMATQQQATQQQQQLANQNIMNSINNKNSEAVSTITNNAATIGNIGNIATLGSGISAVSSGANISNTNVVRDVANIANTISGTSGSSGTSGTASGTSGTSGTASGTSGTSGTASGTSGTSGTASGTSGTSGTATSASGTSGTSGTSASSASTASTASGTSGTASTASGTSTKQGGTYDQDYKEYKDNYNSQYGDTDNTQYEDTGEYEDTEVSEQPMRIYNPIDYKYHYRGEQGLPRPNVCSYGTKQIVQPIFLNSSTLFQGTDLREAAENTQVGSIMPKFEYYEYEDTN